MTLREKLLKNYENELIIITKMADEGVTTVAAAVWDFTLAPGLRPPGFIPIETAVAEIENRIEILSDPECSQKVVQNLNY
jgi:hypothetical protein